MNRSSIILLTLATFFAGDYLGGALLENVLYRSPQRFPLLYEGRFNCDVVCIGNSRGVQAFDAPLVEERTGKSVANISHNAMSPRVARAIFADYLDHNVKPQLLIIEATCAMSRTTRGMLLDYKPFWGRSERLQKLGAILSPKTVLACHLSRLYRYNSEMYLRAVSYWLRGQGDQARFMYQRISPALVAETEQMDPVELPAAPEELEALQGLIQDARDAGIEVRLISVPYLPAYAERISNLDSMLAEISQAAGQEIFDFSRALSDDDQFADRVHMHRNGCRAITEVMLERGVFD